MRRLARSGRGRLPATLLRGFEARRRRGRGRARIPATGLARDERGAGTALVGSLAIVLCMAMLVGVWVVGWIDSVHRARGAADLSALAAAQAQVAGRDVCSASRAVATRNDATVTQCHLVGDRRDFVVRVTVRVELRPRIAGAAHFVEEQAVAGSQRG